MARMLLSAVFVAVCAAVAAAQTPQPFPRPGGAGAPSGPPPPAQPDRRTPDQTAAPAPAPPSPVDSNAPSTTAVGFPIFPGAQSLASYDAGKGQQYLIYGVTAAYPEVVKWYQTQLRDRGTEVFEEPATHMFAQRFNENTMAFPPGVTVKDWTSGGSQGYPNPKIGAQPPRFPVIVMIVPPLPPPAGAR